MTAYVTLQSVIEAIKGGKDHDLNLHQHICCHFGRNTYRTLFI